MLSDWTYDYVLAKVAAGEEDYGSYGDSEDQEDWESEEEGMPKKPKKSDNYEKAVFELIEQK